MLKPSGSSRIVAMVFAIQTHTPRCERLSRERERTGPGFEVAGRAEAFGYPDALPIRYANDSQRSLGPGMTLYPHDHRMWAVIGIYSGREDNAFYHRSENGLVSHGVKTLSLKETIPLGEAVIHAVTNPLDRITAALHVYGGDFFAVPRSEWDPQTFQERPFDIEHAREVFAESNKRLGHSESGSD